MSGHNTLQEMLQSGFEVEDPGDTKTIYVDRWGAVVKVVTAAAETRTLAAPEKAGLECMVLLDVYVGDMTLTVTDGWNQAADTTMTFGTAGDWVKFISVKVGSAYYWRVVASEGVSETLTEEIDVHNLTALGAVPASDDRVPLSDESATSDPPRYATVTELLSAAGDMTDLAAVPAVDDRVLLTDESATGDPAKSTTVENLFSALGDVTALAAAPATDDLMVCTDESAAGDPIKAITVTQLMTAAGDLTDLAATPALDDRLLVTDESESGDPAKSMSVQNVLNARATAVNSTGVGAKNGATVAAAETGVPGHLMKTVLTCTATPFTFGDEGGQGQFGGTKVYDFPDGLIVVLGVVVQGTITLTAPAIDNWDGDVGVGVEAPTDHQDATNKTGIVMPKVAVSAGAADKIGVVAAASAATALTESGARWLDGTGTAKDLFLNFLVDDDAAHDNTITGTFTGTVTLVWMNIGDLT